MSSSVQLVFLISLSLALLLGQLKDDLAQIRAQVNTKKEDIKAIDTELTRLLTERTEAAKKVAAAQELQHQIETAERDKQIAQDEKDKVPYFD